MSSAGRAANSNGCASKPKEHATGLIGFAAQIRRSLLIGSCAMETAEHREPCESRGSRTDLGAPGGEIPPGDSTFATVSSSAAIFPESDEQRKAIVRETLNFTWDFGPSSTISQTRCLFLSIKPGTEALIDNSFGLRNNFLRTTFLKIGRAIIQCTGRAR